MERRKFMVAAGTGAVVAVAGCSGGGGGGGGSFDTSSPTAVVESFYQVGDGLDQDSSADELLSEIEPGLHSASPFPDIFEQAEDQSQDQASVEPRSLSSVSAEVTEEDVSADRLSQEFGLGIFGVSQEDIDTIAEENAIVEATVEYEDGSTENPQHLTATENGDWLIVV